MGRMLLTLKEWKDSKRPKETLYEIGGVNTCEDNFENLKRNWGPKYVTNANEIEILSYRFVSTLKNKRQIKRLIDEKVMGMYATVRHSRTQSNDVITQERRINVRLPFAEPDSVEKAMGQGTRRGYLSYILSKGLNVYEITLTFNGDQYKYLVCCDPANMKIVGDTMFNFAVDEL